MQWVDMTSNQTMFTMNNSKKSDLRKVVVAGNKTWSVPERKGYFHGWVSFSRPGESGVDQGVMGLVELEQGQVLEVSPESIRFVEAFDLVSADTSKN